jgi:hypothetical protein
VTTLLALVLVLAVLSVGIVGRRAVALDGLATAEFLVSASGQASWLQRPARVRRARVRLAATSFALAVTAAAAGSGLVVGSSPAGLLVSLLAGLSLALRSRLFGRMRVGVSLLIAGAAVTVAAALRLVLAPPADVWWWPSLLGGLLAGLVLAVQQRHPPHPTTPGRGLLHWLEATAVTTMICALGVAVGLVELVAGIAGRG